MTPQDHLLSSIKAFYADKRLSEREFSELAVGNPKFMTRLRQGAVRLGALNKALLFMEQRQQTPWHALRDEVEAGRTHVSAQASAA